MDAGWNKCLTADLFLPVEQTTYSNGQTDIWLVRTDAYGNQLWQKSIGGAAFDFANMVKPVTGWICDLRRN